MAAASEVFPLANRSPGMPRVTAFLVKVTDASLRSLKAALNESNAAGSSISFTPSDGGQITFGVNAKPFKFTLSDMQKDTGAKGPLEAVEHFAGESRWQRVGLTRYRAAVMATDDSYQSTKQKALQAEEAAKKVSAKVLKQPRGTGASKASQKMWKKVNDAASAIAKRPLTPLSGSSLSPGLAGSASSVVQGKSTTPGGSSNNGRGLDVRKKSLRERIVHNLLVNSCGPRELMSRMVKEGLTSEERQNFEATFEAVAQPKVQSASNASGETVYELKAQCLSEVNDDWPFYSSWHRQVAKRALAARLSGAGRPPKSAETVNVQMVPRRKEESDKSRPFAGISQSSKSRPAADGRSVLDDILPARDEPKQQTYHKRRLETTSGSSTPTKERRTNDDIRERKVKSSFRQANGYDGGVKSGRTAYSRMATNTSSANSQSTSSESCEHKVGVDSSDGSPSSDFGYWDEYGKIETLEQRSRYKELFDSQYPQYKQYYDKLESILNEFTSLSSRLSACEQGSQEFEAIERQMLSRYAQVRADKYMDTLRKHHDRLRSKLSVLKARVSEFDKRHGFEEDSQ